MNRGSPLLFLGVAGLVTAGIVLLTREASASTGSGEEPGSGGGGGGGTSVPGGTTNAPGSGGSGGGGAPGELPTPPGKPGVGGPTTIPGGKPQSLSDAKVEELLYQVADTPGPVLTWDGLTQAVADLAKAQDLVAPNTQAGLSVLKDQIKKISEKVIEDERQQLLDDHSDVHGKTWSKPGDDKTFFAQLADLLTKKERKEKWGDETSGKTANKIYNWSLSMLQNMGLAFWNAKRAVQACKVKGKGGADLYRCAVTDEILPAMGLSGPKGEYGDLTDNQRNNMIEDDSPGEIRDWFLKPIDKKLWSSVTPNQRKRIYDTAVYFWPTVLAAYIRQWSA